MENIIETTDLCYSFNGKDKVLSNINLQISKGSIYGFLGQNGAGKTTTLRLLLGLLKKQTGDVKICGLQLETNRIAILKGIGSLIEQPSVYGHLSAFDNLRIYQEVTNSSRNKIPEVLETVMLSDTGKKKAKHFSLGMKQRLAIAIALLHDPELLILDEPTNGLDPHGIIEIRMLMQRLNRDNGITILFSSHLLSEVEKVATHLGIIHQGRLVFQGPLENLYKKISASFVVRLETDNNAAVLPVLSQNKIDYTMEEEYILAYLPDREATAWLSTTLVNNGYKVYHLAPQASNLEQLFLKLTNP